MDNKTPQRIKAIAIRELRLARPSKSLDERARAQLAIVFNGELQKQADLLHVEAVLVSEGINDNDDAFTREELKKAISSPILKPMNWKHNDDKILGAMYAVEARDLKGNVLTAEQIGDQHVELVIQGVVWHHLPHIKKTAEEIVSRIEKNNLYVSMECWFDSYNYGFYTQAGDLYDLVPRNPETAFLEGHLRSNGGTGKFNGMRIGRALTGVSFGGIAFVDRPANKRSLILNHFAFDPTDILDGSDANKDGLDQGLAVTDNVESNGEPTEVMTMANDLNRTAASADEITNAVQKALEARESIKNQERARADLDSAVARVAELEGKLTATEQALKRIQSVIDSAFAGATKDTPPEIAKIDQALEVKGDAAGEAVYAAKIAWIADSRAKAFKAVAEVQNAAPKTDEKLTEENKTLKLELASLKNDIRKTEIEYIFAEMLELSQEEVAKFVEAGLAKASDADYTAWLEEKKVLAKKMLELKKGQKTEAEGEEAEAGLLSPSDRETPIADEGAVLRPRNGRVPSDVPRKPRSKLSAAVADLETLFEEVREPNLAGAQASGEENSGSPMGRLVADLLGNKNDKKE